MGGPKPTPRSRPEGKLGAPRKDAMSKPEQRARGEPLARRSGKPMNLKVDVENLEPPSPHPIPASPIEKHVVNPQTPKSARRSSYASSYFLQPDQFIAELKVKTGADIRSELSLNDSPQSARSVRSSRSYGNGPLNEAEALEPPSPAHLRKSPEPHFHAQPASHNTEVAGTKRETMSRRADIATPRAETGLETFYEPANAVPRLELSYEGKPAPVPAHLRIRTGTGVGHNSTNSMHAKPSLDHKNSEEIANVRKSFNPELQRSSSSRERGARSPALVKLQATSALVGGSWSPANLRERLVRSVSGKKESSSREGGDSRAVHSFHAGMSTRPHSQPIKSTRDVEGNDGKPAGRLRRMLYWGASKTGLEVLKTLGRKLGKKSSKVSSGSKDDKMGEQIETAEREIREVSDRGAEKIDPEDFDDGNWSPRSSTSSVSTTYSDISSKSHSYKHSHHKKSAKSEVTKSKLWLLRVHQKLHGRPSKESEDDSVDEAVRGATFHGTPDSTFKDVERKSSPGSARFNLEKLAISKLVAKHKRNSTWDAGKLSPADHLFSPNQPRLPKSDAHMLLAPPKSLTGDPSHEAEFQRRRGKPNSSSNSKSGSTKSPSPRTMSDPVATPVEDSRSNSQNPTLPASPSSGTSLPTATLNSISPGKAESAISPKTRSVQIPASPISSEVHTPPISPGALPTSYKSSFGSFKGFNSPLPLPVRVEKGGLHDSSPSSPIYPASRSPRRFSSPTRDGMQSTPTSPGLYAPSPRWADWVHGPVSPPGHGASSTSPRGNAASADGAEHPPTSPGGRVSNSESEEIFVLANSSFDSTSSSNSSLVSGGAVKLHPVSVAQQGTRVRSRSASVVGQNGVNGRSKAGSGSSVSDERESSREKAGSDSVSALPVPASPRPPVVSFEQIVAGRGQSPPTDNTLMKFFFKCREIEHLNKFLALQKKRFLESFNPDSKKCFHMILSEAGQGLSSMISTLCTAWLLENTMASASVKWHPIPVMNMSREEMWQHRDAAWLFHVCGIEANALLFLDEIISGHETVVAGRVKRAVAGQDILVIKDEVASSCTIVSEKFRQEAPKLLQARYMKTLLLAGILMDTENLSTGSSRDKQQATILLVGAGSLGRNGFYKHLVNIRDENYVTTFIKEMYGDSNVLTGEKPVQRGQGVGRPKALSASSQSDEKAERPPPSRPAPSRQPLSTTSNAPSEVSAPTLPTSPAPLQKPITTLSRKSESQVKFSRKSEVEAKPSRRSVFEATNDGARKVSLSKKEDAPPNFQDDFCSPSVQTSMSPESLSDIFTVSYQERFIELTSHQLVIELLPHV